jgi:hypothetical protein
MHQKVSQSILGSEGKGSYDQPFFSSQRASSIQPQ